MSLHWIQLIGLLLVSQFAKDNAIVFNSDNDSSNVQPTFKCEQGQSIELKKDDINRFNQIQILILSYDANCKLLFYGHDDDEIQIVFNNDLQLISGSHFNNSHQSCTNLKFEEPNRSTDFCLTHQQNENLNQFELKNIYSSNSSNLTLFINGSNGSTVNDSSIFSINYRFGSRIEKQETIEFLDFKGKKFICDHLFKQCNAPIQCNLSSRSNRVDDISNFTCNYLIRHLNQSSNNRILISHANKQQLTQQHYANNRSNCLDSIEFYDGSLEAADKLIIRLCLPLHQMPLVRSDLNEIFVVYRISNDSKFKNNQLELIAQSESRKTRTTRLAERDKKSISYDTDSCNVYYNASTTSQRSGQIVFKNQLQDQPKDQPCFVHLISSNPFDRIWFYFLNYRPAGLLNTNSLSSDQFPPTDSCRITELRLFDSSDNHQFYSSNLNNLLNKGKSFCGSNQPKICNPNREQCFLPSESYLSTGPRLSLMAINKINPSLYLLPLQFTLNYEFINTQEYGEAVSGTICDRLFDSTKYRHGTVRSTRNLFLYGRGGVKNLSCGYIFRGQPNQRLRIQLYRIKVKSTDCVQQRDSNSGTNKCVFLNNKSNGPTSRFSVWDDVLSDVNNTNNSNNNNDQENQIRIPVDCFCNKTVNFLTPISFHLIGGQATLNFTIENMRSSEDFNDYGFEAFYEFLSTSNDLSQTTPPFVQLEPTRLVQVKTNPPRNYSLATYQLTVPSNYSFDYYQEFKQRKRLIAKPNESVLLYVPNGFLWKNSALRTCSQLSRLTVYWIMPSSSNQMNTDTNHAVATICIEPSRTDQMVNDKLSVLNPDQIQLSFELNHQSNQLSNQNSYSSDHFNNQQLNQLLNTRSLRFYANNSVNQIDLVVELVATSKGQFRFDWLQSISKQDMTSKFHSSMSRTSEPNQSIKQLNDKNDKTNENKSNNKNTDNKTTIQCLAYCPEDGQCLKQDYLCDQIAHCSTSGFDESPLICEAKEQNRLEHFLSIIQTENKIDKITLNDSIFKSNWFILLSSCTVLFTLVLFTYLIVYLRKRNKHHQSMTSNFPSAHLAASLHSGTLQQTGSASSTFSGNSSLTNSSCTNSILCEKRLKKLKQKITNKEQLKQQNQKHHLQSANALTLMRNSLEVDNQNNLNPLIPFGNNSTAIHQQLSHQQINGNQQPADYVSTSEFQFEMNQDRLNNYDKQNDFSPLYKKIDPDEYSLKQQHIYYQPSYTTLQRRDNSSRLIQQDQQQQQKHLDRIDSRLDYRLDQRLDSQINKPPLPPLPLVLQQQTTQPSSLQLSYHSTMNETPHHETFGLRSQTTHLTNLNNHHHTIARQSLLDSNQAERLLMSTPIYDRIDRQFNSNHLNNSSSMHRSALFTANRFNNNRRFS